MKLSVIKRRQYSMSQRFSFASLFIKLLWRFSVLFPICAPETENAWITRDGKTCYTFSASGLLIFHRNLKTRNLSPFYKILQRVSLKRESCLCICIYSIVCIRCEKCFLAWIFSPNFIYCQRRILLLFYACVHMLTYEYAWVFIEHFE